MKNILYAAAELAVLILGLAVAVLAMAVL